MSISSCQVATGASEHCPSWTRSTSRGNLKSSNSFKRVNAKRQEDSVATLDMIHISQRVFMPCYSLPCLMRLMRSILTSWQTIWPAYRMLTAHSTETIQERLIHVFHIVQYQLYLCWISWIRLMRAKQETSSSAARISMVPSVACLELRATQLTCSPASALSKCSETSTSSTRIN